MGSSRKCRLAVHDLILVWAYVRSSHLFPTRVDRLERYITSESRLAIWSAALRIGYEFNHGSTLRWPFHAQE